MAATDSAPRGRRQRAELDGERFEFPVRRLIDISNIEPGATAEINFSIVGHRQSSTDAHSLTGVF